MKKMISGILAFLMVSVSVGSVISAEEPSNNVSLSELENDYLIERHNEIDDYEMFKQFANQYNTVSYFVSDSLQFNEQYDSANMNTEETPVVLGFNIRTNNYAVFYIKTMEQAETAKEILGKHFNSAYEGDYRTVGTCFYVTDYKNKCDFEKTQNTWDNIFSEMIEADIIDDYYYPGEVYEHHELFIPYLTKYLKKETQNPVNNEMFTEEDLQNYVEEKSLPVSVQCVKEKSEEYYYLVPNEKINFNTHFNIAVQLWNDLHIAPYAYDDSFKSSYPTVTAKKGDGNADGKFDLTDAIMTMNYLLSDGDLSDRAVCDMNLDGTLNVIDFSIMKHELLN
jgi:hypothetical protein